MNSVNMELSNDDLAKEILERRLGYRLFQRTVTEKLLYEPHGVELKHTPVIRLLSVQARANHYHDIFGQTDWIDIPIDSVILHQKDNRAAITLPLTIFGTPYTEVKITYEAGLSDPPAEIKEAVQLIAEGLSTGEIDPATGRLPVQVLEVISRHRKGA